MSIEAINRAIKENSGELKGAGRKPRGTMAFVYDVSDESETKEQDTLILERLDALKVQSGLSISDLIKNLVEEGLKQFFQEKGR